MSHQTSSSTDGGIVSALISLLSFIVSFFNTSHVWLQNVTLLVSLIADIIAIAVGIGRLKK